MGLQPSELSERVAIQQTSTSSDGQGGRTTSWSTLATVYAKVQPLNSREAIQARAVASEVAYRVLLRFRSDVDATMRLLWTPSWSSAAGSKTLEIHGVRMQRDALELDCAEAS